MEDFSFLSDGITYHVIATYYDSEYTDNKIKLLNMTTALEKKVGLSFLKTVFKDMNK